jgi:hypothetical protein
VDAAVKTTERRLTGRSRKAGEAAGHSGQEIRAGSEGDVVRAIEPGQHRGGRTAEGAVSGNVIGEWRGDDERIPSWISYRGGIAIRIAIANGGHRAPEVVSILCILRADGRVGHGDIQKCEQARGLCQCVTPRGSNDLGNTIPVPRWRFSAGAVCPE